MSEGYEGQVVVNFRLIRKIGEGGFGAVFLAEHESLGRKAAVKILHPEYARHKEVVERFFREARAVCAIGHQAIIEVQNFGRLESGEPYCLMEFFDGVSMAQHLEEHGPVPLALIESVFEPVVGALAAAHASNIVHRDLKPENIMLRVVDGHVEDVKLLDFGIAKLVDSSDLVTSRTGSSIGTPLYMAPEQHRDAKNVDYRADVYSFGATLFNALVGRPPFVASNMSDLILAIHGQPAPAVSVFLPAVSPELDRALAACLHKEPAERPDTIELAWAAVVEGLRSTNVGSTEQSAETANLLKARFAKTAIQGGSTTLSAATSETQGSAKRRAPGVWVLGAGLVLAATAALAFVVTPRATEGDKASHAPPMVAATSDARSAVSTSPDARLLQAQLPSSEETVVVPSVDGGSAVTPAAAKKGSVAALDCGPGAWALNKLKKLSAKDRRRFRARLARCLEAKAIDPELYEAARSALHKEPEPAPTSKPIVEEKVVTKETDCSIRRFSSIYNAESPSEDAVRAALRQLKLCRTQLGETRYKQVQTALVSKL